MEFCDPTGRIPLPLLGGYPYPYWEDTPWDRGGTGLGDRLGDRLGIEMGVGLEVDPGGGLPYIKVGVGGNPAGRGRTNIQGVLCSSMKGSTLTVVDSNLGNIPEGTTLEVEEGRTNQYTNRRVLTVRPTPTPEDRVEDSTIQICRMPDHTKDVWKEIVVGRDSDTILVVEE